MNFFTQKCRPDEHSDRVPDGRPRRNAKGRQVPVQALPEPEEVRGGGQDRRADSTPGADLWQLQGRARRPLRHVRRPAQGGHQDPLRADAESHAPAQVCIFFVLLIFFFGASIFFSTTILWHTYILIGLSLFFRSYSIYFSDERFFKSS